MDDRQPPNKYITLQDVPEEVLARAVRDIAHYSVSLMAVTAIRGDEDFQLLGSATLIQHKDFYAFLTAAHVLNNDNPTYRECTHVGVVYRESLHSLTIHKSLLNHVVSLGPDPRGGGPDIAVVKMPGKDAAIIGAVKSFWNVEKFAEIVKMGRIMPESGAWVVAGSPGERVENIPPPLGCVASAFVRHYCYFSGIKAVRELDGYDYYDWPATYTRECDPPVSFGGFSGGGLWCVQLRKEDDKPVENMRALLMGTAFYQSGLVNGERVVTCHGPKTLYQRVLSVLLRLPQ